jgi:peptidoglycan/LPS O-acetylase OafA/YrhL
MERLLLKHGWLTERGIEYKKRNIADNKNIRLKNCNKKQFFNLSKIVKVRYWEMYFNSIQYLRGLAAVVVVLYHVNIYSEIIGGQKNAYFSFFNTNFSLGVWLFFVISGFIMAFLIETNYEKFFYRRILRIYPIYLCTVLVVFFVKILFFSTVSNPELLKAISLLPFGEKTYPLSIEWSLIYEVFFYIICTIFANEILQRFFKYFLLLWVIMIFIGFYLLKTPTLLLPTMNTIFFSNYNLLFIFGAFSYYFYKKIKDTKKSVAIISLLTSSIFFLIVLINKLYRNDFEKTIILGILLAGVVLFTAVLSSKESKQNKALLILERFGDYSYALYLTHVAVITITFSVIKIRYNFPINTPIVFVVLVLSLIIGWIVGKFDINLHRLIKKKI